MNREIGEEMKKANLNWLLIFIASIVLWLTAVILWIAIPEEKTLNISTTVAAMALFTSAVLMRREYFAAFYNSSRFKHFSTNLFSALLVFCILAVINHLAYKNPYQFDVTADKANTLTEQSRKVLARIPESVKAVVFAPKAQQGAILKMLELYQIEKRSIEINYYDPELRPDLVKSYQLVTPIAVVWENGEQRQIVTELNELGLTNGLIRLGRDKLPKIYYDIGHGQASLTSNEQNGRALLRQHLVNSNYALQETDTKRWEAIPDDLDVLMIWGPKLGFMPAEIKLLEQFLDNGGKLLVALDPDLNADPVKELRQVLATRGIVASNSLVIDTANHVSGSNGTVPIVNRFADDHAITKDFPGQVFFPLVGFVTLGEQANGKGLVFSTPFPAAWGEMTPSEFAAGKVAYTEGEDVKGPVAFAVAAKPTSGGSIIFFANSTFTDNAYAKYAANHVLLLNSLSWLSSDDQIISFDLAAVDNQPVFISSPQLGVIFFFSVILAPLSLFAIAVWNYRRRRVL